MQPSMISEYLLHVVDFNNYCLSKCEVDIFCSLLPYRTINLPNSSNLDHLESKKCLIIVISMPSTIPGTWMAFNKRMVNESIRQMFLTQSNINPDVSP